MSDDPQVDLEVKLGLREETERDAGAGVILIFIGGLVLIGSIVACLVWFTSTHDMPEWPEGLTDTIVAVTVAMLPIVIFSYALSQMRWLK